MKVYHLTCDWDFSGANLCSNSGVYLSKEKAEEVIVAGFVWDYLRNFSHIEHTLQWLLDKNFVWLEEVDID